MKALLTVDDLGFVAPALAAEDIAEIAYSLFGVSGQLKPLRGERDQNTLITDPDGRQFVLKISGAAEAPETVDFQVRALRHIERSDPDIPVPRLVPGTDGGLVYSQEINGHTHLVRLMSFLPGIPYADGPFPSTGALERIGQFLARLDLALTGFSHPASRTFMAWDICNGLVFSPQFRDLIPPEAKLYCEPSLRRIEHEVYPQLETLRKQVIHQDGHGGNLLRVSAESEEIAGMIDFGDMIHGPLVSDVVITASHFMETAEDPVSIAVALCRGYSAVIPLEAQETDLLLDLVITRQILTLQLFEFRRLNMPNEPVLDEDEKPRIMNSLKRLVELDRSGFAENLRTALLVNEHNKPLN